MKCTLSAGPQIISEQICPGKHAKGSFIRIRTRGSGLCVNRTHLRTPRCHVTWLLLLRDEHGADGSPLRTEDNKQPEDIFNRKRSTGAPCTFEMVSISHWVASTASLMTKQRPGFRNTFEAIHKHFYRTSNP